jgi:hypothetical protein
MKLLKKLGIGSYVLLVSAIVALIAGIIYAANSGAPEFAEQNPNAAVLVPLFNILAAVFFILAVVLSVVPAKGALQKLAPVCTMILIIVGGLFLGLAMINALNAFMYDWAIFLFSDLHAGDTALYANIQGALASMIMSGVVLVIAGIGSMIGLSRGDEAAAA